MVQSVPEEELCKNFEKSIFGVDVPKYMIERETD